MAFFEAAVEAQRARARAAFVAAHECNGYCRNGNHAMVIYVDLMPGHGEAEVEAGLRELLDLQVVEYVSSSYAPEAPPAEGLVGTYDQPSGLWQMEEPLATDRPYLVIWR